MNPKVLASFAIFVLLFGVVSSVAFADEKTDQKSKETRQQATQSKSTNNSEIKNCASNLELLRKLLDDASQKASAFKEKLYAEWKSKYSSGQIKDDWDVYSKKLETSQEMIGYRQTQEKYNLILASCADNSQSKPPESRVQFTSSEECVNAQRMIDDIDQRYSVLKQKAYADWKSQNAAGTYPGTWEQYANEFINSTPVTELNQARQKYEPVLRTCYVQTNAKSFDLPQSASTVESQRQSCPDADIERMRIMLNDSGQKVSALKERLYSEWKSSYDSGQIKDDWDVYAKKKFEGSQEFVTYMQLQQKLDSLYKMCRTIEKPQPADDPKPVNPEPRVQFVQSEECVSAQKTIESIDQRYSVLKQKAYADWKSQNAVGTYTGTWEQYADEKLIKSTDVLELGKMREKYEPFLRTCYVQSGASSDVSQTKPLLQTPKTTDQKSPAKITQKPSPPVSKTDKKPYGVTDDSTKKSDKSIKLTKAKPDKLIKKPQRQFVQK
jgi:methionine salvage enolase-phosphatase E1